MQYKVHIKQTTKGEITIIVLKEVLYIGYKHVL